jgi:L-fuculose-phosphate aldolase
MNTQRQQLHREQLHRDVGGQMHHHLAGGNWSVREQMAIGCRYLAREGHCETLAGQITVRLEGATLATTPLGTAFDELRPADVLLVDQDLKTLEGSGMANPATRFHLWVYRARPEVHCIVHTHPPAASALSMIGQPLIVAHMDQTPFHDDCAFLAKWPGLPIADDEGEIIAGALGGKRSILLAHHGLLTAGRDVAEAIYLAVMFEQAARRQLMAAAAGTIVPVDAALARESHDFLLQPSIVGASFAMYARRLLRSDGDFLSAEPAP